MVANLRAAAGLDEFYPGRGEVANHTRELKNDLKSDTLSRHSFFSKSIRIWLVICLGLFSRMLWAI